MNWRDLHHMQHLRVHTGEPGAQDGAQNLVLRGLNEEDIRLVPIEGQNSIAWLLWHMARCEDVAANDVLSDRGQVLDDSWKTAMGITRRDIGTGMTPAEVSELSQRIELDALLSYRSAVATRSRDVVDHIEDSYLESHMTPLETEALRDMGTFAQHAGWVSDLWAPKPRLWFLWLLTGHNYMHLQEALTVRSLGGRPLGL